MFGQFFISALNTFHSKEIDELYPVIKKSISNHFSFQIDGQYNQHIHMFNLDLYRRSLCYQLFKKNSIIKNFLYETNIRVLKSVWI